MYEYTIEWHTKPAPGSTFYSGTKTFRCNYNERSEVLSRAQREVSRELWVSPSSIVITRLEAHNTVLVDSEDYE